MFAEVPTVLDSLVKTDPALRQLVAQLDCTQRSRAWNDGKITAHHGIIPTLEPANLAAMSEKELAVYKLIRAHCLAQCLPHHEFDHTTARLAFGGQNLEAVGKQVIVPGWRLVLAAPEPADEEGETGPRSQVLPPLREGLACQIGQVDLKALKTLPPEPPFPSRQTLAGERRTPPSIIRARWARSGGSSCTRSRRPLPAQQSQRFHVARTYGKSAWTWMPPASTIRCWLRRSRTSRTTATGRRAPGSS